MFRPSVLLGIAVAMVSSCGETPSPTLAKHARSPFLSQSDYPGLVALHELAVHTEREEREMVDCDLVPPPERLRTPECVPPKGESNRPLRRPGREPYPDLEDPYAGLEPLPWEEPFPFETQPPAPITRYQVPREEPGLEIVPVPLPKPELGGFSQAALGVGAAGLGVAAMGMAIGADDPTNGTMIFGGAMAGLGLAALAVGGIVALIESDESEDSPEDPETTIVVAPGAIGISGAF